jgi:F0F1-type ATP synthase alpha subunit
MSEERERLRKIISQGQGAQEWLNHPQFQHAITLQKAELMSAFEKTKFKETDVREEVWRKLQALNSVVSGLERQIRDASNAEKTLFDRIKEKLT